MTDALSHRGPDAQDHWVTSRATCDERSSSREAGFPLGVVGPVTGVVLVPFVAVTPPA